MTSPLPDLRQFASLFVVKPSSLGDIVHTLPSVHFIKRAHPHLQIRWVCNPEWMPLLEGNADLHEVIPFPRREFRGLMGAPKFVSWAYRLNTAKRVLPEAAVDFQGLLRSAVVCKSRGSNPIIGLSDSREGASMLHQHVISVDAGAHAVDRYLAVPQALGIPTPEDQITFTLPPGTPPRGNLPSDFIIIHPYARGTGKSLSTEVLQTLCDCLSPHPVVLAGHVTAAPEISGKHVISLLNKTDLHELFWLLRQARGCISVDSGPMHIAAAIQPRTLGVHTWSDPRKVGPYPLPVKAWKAGRIAHRLEFTNSEASAEVQPGPIDARRIADFVLREWY